MVNFCNGKLQNMCITNIAVRPSCTHVRRSLPYWTLYFGLGFLWTVSLHCGFCGLLTQWLCIEFQKRLVEWNTKIDRITYLGSKQSSTKLGKINASPWLNWLKKYIWFATWNQAVFMVWLSLVSEAKTRNRWDKNLITEIQMLSSYPERVFMITSMNNEVWDLKKSSWEW